jgi:hypothetical protein
VRLQVRRTALEERKASLHECRRALTKRNARLRDLHGAPAGWRMYLPLRKNAAAYPGSAHLRHLRTGEE